MQVQASVLVIPAPVPGPHCRRAKKSVSVLALNVCYVADKPLSGWAVDLAATKSPRFADKFSLEIRSEFFNLQPGTVRAGGYSIFSCLVNIPRNWVLACLDRLSMPWGSGCKIPAA